jgi:hypothetical protein
MTSSACWSRSFHPPSSAGGRGPRTCGVCWTGCSTSCAPAGCQWRHLPPPPAFPPWRTVYGYLRAFLRDGVWESIRHHFVVMLREGAGREASPTAVVIDTRSVKTTESGGPRGWDAAKRLMGRKRHVAVDTDGLLLGVLVHAANIQDADALGDLLRRVKPPYNWLRVVFADSICGQHLQSACRPARLLPGRSGADHRPSCPQALPASSCSRADGWSKGRSAGLDDGGGCPRITRRCPRCPRRWSPWPQAA